MAPIAVDDAPSEAPASALPVPAANPRDLATELAIAKAMTVLATDRDKSLRAQARESAVFFPGDGLTVVSPADRRVRLAKVSATDPKPTAVFTDRPAFDEWMFREHDDKCSDVETLSGARADVIAALREHCPAELFEQLVTVERTVPEWAASQVLKTSASRGEVVGIEGEIGEHAPPGVLIQEPDSVLQIRLEDGAAEHIAQLWGDHLDSIAAYWNERPGALTATS